MKIKVCIGSSCHLKGSRQVVEQLQALIAQKKLEDQIELAGTFCMNNCQNGVCVSCDDQIYSLTPDTVDQFFNNEVLTKLLDTSQSVRRDNHVRISEATQNKL